MATLCDRDQFVLDARLTEPPRHRCRLRVGYVGVLITVQQEGRRVIPGDVPLGAIQCEEVRVRVGVDAGDFARPKTVLRTVEVEVPAPRVSSSTRTGNWAIADRDRADPPECVGSRGRRAFLSRSVGSPKRSVRYIKTSGQSWLAIFTEDPAGRGIPARLPLARAPD